MAAKTSVNIPKTQADKSAGPRKNIVFPRVPKGLRIIFAVFALLIIIGFVAIMMTQIILKASDLVGLQQAPITTINCTDTDNGNFQDAFGTCTDSNRKENSDTCVLTGLREELKLNEWFCVNNTCKSEIKDCNPGFNCAGGICTQG